MLQILSLHPEHIQNETISAISWCGQTPSSFTVPAYEQLVVDWANPSCLRIRSCSDDPVSVVDVDLILAEVTHDWDSDSNQNVIIVKPWCDKQSPQITEINLKRLRKCISAPSNHTETFFTMHNDQLADEECQGPEFWIFLVRGDAAAVQAVLRRMGEGGSVRYKPFEVLGLGAQIGAGANAIVYCGKHCHPDHVNDDGCEDNIVFKVLHRNPDCATAFEELDVIQHEISLVIHAGKHPNIIKFLGVFCLEDGAVATAGANTASYKLLSKDNPSGLLPRWALMSEYLPGGDVFDAASKQPFKERRARQVMADLLSACAHIHRRGIVHRDVKVENLLLGKDGRAVLTDFGIAALVSDEEAMGKYCGSPGYAAPEILCSKPYGIKIDSFSAGAVLYFMLCGKLPFEGKKLKVVLKRTLTSEVSFDNHPEFSKVTHNCKSFILKLLEKVPEKRLSAEQAASQLWRMDEAKNRRLPEGTNQSMLSTKGGRANLNLNDVGNVLERTFDDQFIACDQQTAHTGGSAFRYLRSSQSNHKKSDGSENDLEDSLTESCGQRASLRGSWSQKINHLMSKLRTNKTNGPTLLQSMSTDMNRGSAMSVPNNRTCDQKAQASPYKSSVYALSSDDLSDRERSTALLAEEQGRVTHASSSSSGSTSHSCMTQASTQCSVQVPALGCLKERMSPESRPTYPSPLAKVCP